ncbi:coiled-coil domain-containing protein 84-like [Scleropages formosus]|uniref:Coiled-coil domain-containing protein 84-like n=1 Tax=Scleropages formosus TaxID=113540 RepID=A0A0P7XJP4_SCLFO|nr:coiled-coil domain-containing protein 84-like [Scleropages formosus]
MIITTMDAFYCAVCRQTSFAGKGHRYGKSHQAKLKVVLVKFLEKVKEARRTVKNPRVEKFRSAEHETSFWCYCCAREVPKHVSNGDVAVLFGGLLEHMATPEHKKNTNKFWWENKAEPKLKEKFLITSEEAERFKTEVARALETFEEKEDELIKQQAAIIRAQEQHRKEVLQSLLEVGLPRMPLNCIHIADSSSCGNVHTGAIPPWLLDDPLEGSSGNTEREIGPSHQEFLKHMDHWRQCDIAHGLSLLSEPDCYLPSAEEQEKLRKLPAHRVGANFDHTSQTDANWLPSFGRVWNSGRRWQSRHQFREEEGQVGRQKRKWSSQGKGGKKPRLDLP